MNCDFIEATIVYRIRNRIGPILYLDISLRRRAAHGMLKVMRTNALTNGQRHPRNVRRMLPASIMNSKQSLKN